MIVVAIIGILAAVAIPRFANLVEKSKEARIKGGLGALRSAISIYYSDTEKYPQDLDVALTTSFKYLKEIPPVEIPSIDSAGNPGHPNSSVVTTGIDDFATGAWLYDPTLANGEIHVNCTHFDSKGTVWSSY